MTGRDMVILTAIEMEDIEDAADSTSVKLRRDYRGRGMTGHCVGIRWDIPGQTETFLSVLWEINAGLAARLRSMEQHTDTMGQGMITYWPGVRPPRP